MADIVTGTVTGYVNNLPETTLKEISDGRREAADRTADIRLEGAQHTADIQLENMKGFDRVNADVLRSSLENIATTKDARHDINSRISDIRQDLSQQVDAIDDTLTVAIHQVSRDSMDLRAQVSSLGFQVRDGFVAAAKDSEINALKTQVELAKQTTYLSDKIDEGNDRTRALINDLRDRELNRFLIERNAEIVEERHGRRHWHHVADQNQFQGQWAALQSQLQAFQSQLQETRQGMVNFGTMAGVGQTSTSNNVR